MRTRAAVQSRPTTTSSSAIQADGLTLLTQLGLSGKDKAVYEASNPYGEHVAVAVYHKKKGASIRTEAAFQSRAAAAGLAPHVIQVQTTQLVMELLTGGSLFALARASGRLTQRQQKRIIFLLTTLGAPESEGGASIRHADSGNPANYVADAAGELYLIDFAPPHVKEIGALPPDANLSSIGKLLWDARTGLIRRGFVTEPPQLLLQAYRLYCRKNGKIDPRDPEPNAMAVAHDEAVTMDGLELGAAQSEAKEPRSNCGRGLLSFVQGVIAVALLLWAPWWALCHHSAPVAKHVLVV